jgi:two-component system, OmpR family, sensor histidine kinase KdpD
VTTALANFFQPDNLSTLRELALREVAESVDRASVMQHRLRAEPANSTAARVMVCLASSSPRAPALLRRGSRLAGRLNTDWYAAYVETPKEAPHMIGAEAQRQLHTTIQKAMELGAEVVRLKAEDPVPALINFAKSHGVGYIVIGRSHAPFWKRLLRWAPMDRMVDAAEGFDLHIVSYDDQDLQL